jgi:type III restriction enzyme
VILLLRKFGSRVYGQQVVGRGLRRVRVKGVEPTEPQICAVVDHPKLDHQWLWDIFNARKREGVLIDDLFDETADLPPPPPKQELLNPDLVVDLPPVDPSFLDDGEFDLGDFGPPPQPLRNWQETRWVFRYPMKRSGTP